MLQRLREFHIFGLLALSLGAFLQVGGTAHAQDWNPHLTEEVRASPEFLAFCLEYDDLRGNRELQRAARRHGIFDRRMVFYREILGPQCDEAKEGAALREMKSFTNQHPFLDYDRYPFEVPGTRERLLHDLALGCPTIVHAEQNTTWGWSGRVSDTFYSKKLMDEVIERCGPDTLVVMRLKSIRGPHQQIAAFLFAYPKFETRYDWADNNKPFCINTADIVGSINLYQFRDSGYRLFYNMTDLEDVQQVLESYRNLAGSLQRSGYSRVSCEDTLVSSARSIQERERARLAQEERTARLQDERAQRSAERRRQQEENQRRLAQSVARADELGYIRCVGTADYGITNRDGGGGRTTYQCFNGDWLSHAEARRVCDPLSDAADLDGRAMFYFDPRTRACHFEDLN